MTAKKSGRIRYGRQLTSQRPKRGSPKRSKDPAVMFAYHVRNAAHQRGPQKLILLDGRVRAFKESKEIARGVLMGVFSATADLDAVAQAYRDALGIPMPPYVFNDKPDRACATRRRLAKLVKIREVASLPLPQRKALQRAPAVAKTAPARSPVDLAAIDSYLTERLAAGMQAA